MMADTLDEVWWLACQVTNIKDFYILLLPCFSAEHTLQIRLFGSSIGLDLPDC